MDKKFLGICIVIASLILSGTVLYTTLFTDTKDRYKVAGARVFDTQEGKFVDEPKNNAHIAAETVTNTSDTSKNKNMRDDESQVLDSSIIKYDVQIPEQNDSAESHSKTFCAHNLGITASNISTKYIVTYIVVEIKLYKDDVIFLKETKIIGDEKSIKISPLSSYNTNFSIDTQTSCPDKPWRSELTTKAVRGIPIE